MSAAFAPDIRLRKGATARHAGAATSVVNVIMGQLVIQQIRVIR